MLRRLLACLALITGLAAVGAPLSVSAAEAMSQQVSNGSCVSEQGREQRCDCAEKRTNQPFSRKKSSTGCKPRKPVLVNIPPLYLGPDRALE
ncbi:hypothetical protein [Parerythrobacter lacustris]|uniref:Uncharacterized protein n=1 Tax=Parerythrobacter lacustris TaxID=2969984 RepID=A0ABT1XUE8_9SPHN|nr:hypothetical protein [Parerythrobacter lacustris]MCR2834047.1 hypothetical protein [Parerythrobacter lacustris]